MTAQRIPNYRHHRASGQAFVELSKRRFYLGVHGSRDSWDRYNELVKQWLAIVTTRSTSAVIRPSMKRDDLLAVRAERDGQDTTFSDSGSIMGAQCEQPLNADSPSAYTAMAPAVSSAGRKCRAT